MHILLISELPSCIHIEAVFMSSERKQKYPFLPIFFERDLLGTLQQSFFNITRVRQKSIRDGFSGRILSKPTSSLLGTQVLAEIPDSVRQHSPLERLDGMRKEITRLKDPSSSTTV